MRIVDCHTHCFPDAVAERAVGRLTTAYHVTPSFDGTVRGLIGQMDACGFEASVVLPVATKASQVPSINDWAIEIMSERVIPFGAMHPEFPEPEQELDRIHGIGIRGVKLHPNWQGFRPEDPQAFPIYEALGEKGMIAYFHGGDELEAWPEPIASTPEALGHVHRRFPRLKMVIAHMGGYRMWDAVEEHLIGREIHFDVSACFPADIPDERLVRMMRAHGVDKIMYGSDCPCGPPMSQLRRMLSLPLTSAEKALICWENADRLLGL